MDLHAARGLGPYTQADANHLAWFGHPSEQGCKDILRQRKAEKWDPDKLMALYKRAGARYVIGQGMHHDNFDLWTTCGRFYFNPSERSDICLSWKPNP